MTSLTPHETEVHRLKSDLEIMQALLAAVSSSEPLRSLTSRMSVLCQGAAMIYDFEGKILASTGAAPTQLIWNEVAASRQPELVLEVGRWHIRTRRVSLQGGVHVIAIASHVSVILDRNGNTILDTAEQMLGAVHGISYGASQRDRRENEQLLAALHDGILPSREHRFWNRLSQFHFLAYAPVRAVEIAPFTGDSSTEQDTHRLAEMSRTHEFPMLVMLRRVNIDAAATIAALVPDSAAATHWLERISQEFLVGVSSPFSSLSKVPAEAHEAEIALKISQRHAQPGIQPGLIGPVWNDQLDLTAWILSRVDTRELHQRRTRTLEPIYDEVLRDTLVTYLVLDQNVAKTAAALFVHANTIRYRLARIGDLMGSPIDSAHTLANLVLCLDTEIHVEKLRRQASEIKTLE